MRANRQNQSHRRSNSNPDNQTLGGSSQQSEIEDNRSTVQVTSPQSTSFVMHGRYVRDSSVQDDETKEEDSANLQEEKSDQDLSDQDLINNFAFDWSENIPHQEENQEPKVEEHRGNSQEPPTTDQPAAKRARVEPSVPSSSSSNKRPLSPRVASSPSERYRAVRPRFSRENSPGASSSSRPTTAQDRQACRQILQNSHGLTERDISILTPIVHGNHATFETLHQSLSLGMISLDEMIQRLISLRGNVGQANISGVPEHRQAELNLIDYLIEEGVPSQDMIARDEMIQRLISLRANIFSYLTFREQNRFSNVDSHATSARRRADSDRQDRSRLFGLDRDLADVVNTFLSAEDLSALLNIDRRARAHRFDTAGRALMANRNDQPPLNQAESPFMGLYREQLRASFQQDIRDFEQARPDFYRRLIQVFNNDPQVTEMRALNIETDADYAAGDYDAPSILSAMRTNRTVTRLELYNTLLEDDDASRLAAILRVNQGLTSLTFRPRQDLISNTTVRTLIDALQNNQSLTYLGLSNAAVRTLIDALQNNQSLTYLALSDCNGGDEEAEIIANMLQNNDTLRTLIYSRHDHMSGQGVIPIANALATNTTLTYLDLSGNNIGDSGAEFLANALATNTTLTYLDLSENNIGDAGAEFLANALRPNTTLIHLHRIDNNIGDSGVEVLASALQTNTTLTHLDLSDNNIGHSGVRALAIAQLFGENLTIRF